MNKVALAGLYLLMFLPCLSQAAGAQPAHRNTGKNVHRPDPGYLAQARVTLQQAFVAGETARAKQALEQLLSATPDDSELLTLQAAQGLPGQSSSSLQEDPLNAWNESALIAQARGNQSWLRGQWPAARAAFERAHHLAPQHPDPLYSLGICHLQLNEPERAAYFLQQAREKRLNAVSRLTENDIRRAESDLAILRQP